MTNDNIINESLPYAKTLNNAQKKGTVLHRDDIYGSGPPVDAVSEDMLNFIITHAKKNILDIGCGFGSYMDRLISKGIDCTGVETNNNCVTYSRNKGLHVLEMEAQNLKFSDESFDTIIMVEVLEHLENPDLVMNEIKRVTNNNLIISVPNIESIPYLSKYNVVPWHILEATHINFFTKDSLKNYLKKFFNNVYVEEYGLFANWCEEKKLYYHIRAVASD